MRAASHCSRRAAGECHPVPVTEIQPAWGRRHRPHPFASRWNHNAHYYPTIDALVPATARTVLDVGCGDGTLAHYLARSGRRAEGRPGSRPGDRAELRVHGVDPDAAVLPADGGRVSFSQGVAEALPCEDGSVDVVTMVMALHHVDHRRALAEIRRVLRPGGTVVLLGYGRNSTAGDRLREVVDVVAHRRNARGTTEWQPPVAVAEPDLSWTEIRRRLAAELPGGRYRRLPMWRYLYTWTSAGPRPEP